MIYGFTLAEHEFRLLRDLVHQRYGLDFREDKITLFQMRLYPQVLALGMASFSEYLQHLKYAADREMEWFKVISALTNNETYFFRETNQLDSFRDHLLPEAGQRAVGAGVKSLRILSAGCSTGEEVYTLAMMIYETGRYFWGWNITLVGMDIDERALQVARQGFYFERSLRMTPPEQAERFFTRENGGFRVKDAVAKMGSFRHGNILDAASWHDRSGWDFIFCRNALIYFSEGMVKRAADVFYDALVPGGYLLLGHSESLSGIHDGFQVVRCPGGLVYQKAMPEA